MTCTGRIDVQRDRLGTATVVVGDGRRANALDTSDWLALAAQVTELGCDELLRAVVVRGAGTATFCAGSDMREWLDGDPATVDASFSAMERALTAIERIPVPTVAAVRGSAAGAGCQLACACDIRIVTSAAQLGMPIARWGILVSPAFAARLARVTGTSLASDLLFSGRLVGAAEAVRSGLATREVADADLEDVTAEMVATISELPPESIRAAKRAVNALREHERQWLSATPTGPAADYPNLRDTVGAFLGTTRDSVQPHE